MTEGDTVYFTGYTTKGATVSESDPPIGAQGRVIRPNVDSNSFARVQFDGYGSVFLMRADELSSEAP